jgi:hypothetical protein
MICHILQSGDVSILLSPLDAANVFSQKFYSFETAVKPLEM